MCWDCTTTQPADTAPVVIIPSAPSRPIYEVVLGPFNRYKSDSSNTAHSNDHTSPTPDLLLLLVNLNTWRSVQSLLDPSVDQELTRDQTGRHDYMYTSAQSIETNQHTASA
jgi:hypothetical protein